MSRLNSILLLALFALSRCVVGSADGFHQSTSAEPASPHHWQTPARLHSGWKTRAGTLSIGTDGVAFVGPGAPAVRWSFQEIQDFEISPHRLVVTSYENRHHHEPGNQRYRFDLQSEVPPQLADEVARWLGKPSRNADPDRQAGAFAAIPAKHLKRFGGSNGELRFDAGGLEFITAVAGDTRAWRWSDIQTIANPDPYHFRVAGYLETYEFELKQPMSPRLFDRLWTYVYGQGLNLPDSAEEASHAR